MPTIKLTDRSLKALKPPAEGRVEYFDATVPGFGLRLSDTGRVTWIVFYRVHGRLRRYTMGTYPAMPLADARENAKDALRQAAKGLDPAAEKKATRKAETFKELATDYLERYAKKQKRSWKEDERAINRDLIPRLGSLKAKEIKRRDVVALLEKIVDRGAPVLANRTHEILRRIYNWGISRDLVDANPCAGVEKPAAESRRERVLTDDEIRAVWAAVETQPAVVRAMFRLRFLTGQRGGEIAKMRHADIDRSGWWTIPAEFSKNGLPHRVPLSEPVRAILAEAAPLSGKSPWLFPGSSIEQPRVNPWRAVANIREKSKVDFTPHDIRRTVATRLTGDLGFDRLLVKKVLNHVESDVTAIYDRHSYDAEKRQALDAWAKRLEEIVTGKPAKEGNVVPLPTRGA